MSGTQDIFHSRDSRCKSPYGAVPKDTQVQLTLRPRRAEGVSRCTLTARYEMDGDRTLTLPMEWSGLEEGRDLYTASLPAGGPGLVWYSFRAERFNADPLELAPYQLTVYDDSETVPAWFGRGVTYQIFPDRFCRSHIPDPTGMVGGRTVHENWADCPQWQPDEQGQIRNRDFFGGDLAGIMEKLDYLKELGVDTIYFNPIFEAAENHRYGTADYGNIDPMLGTEQDFRRLCEQAHRRGIRVMLDGVFNHAGFVSRYFNGDGFYGPGGASRDPNSPYRSWFRFTHWPDRYDSWWGIRTLPAFNAHDPGYRRFVFGDGDSVIRRWLRAGADGWRLDVADEVPDDFVAGIHRAARTEKPSAVVIGEVWEDGSTKIAYSVRRKHILGGHCDGLMNYPFRTAVLNFLLGQGAEQFVAAMETLRENYPPSAFFSAMNSLGTHDTPRALTLLALGSPCTDQSRQWRADFRLNGEQRRRGVERLKVGSALLFCFPGSPTVYYGDEAGMEGFEDPFNRRTYPWGQEDKELLDWYAALGRLRHRHQALQIGNIEYMFDSRDLLVFSRRDGQETVLCACNAGEQPQTCLLDFPATPLLGDCAVEPREEGFALTLPPRSAAVLLKEAGIPCGPKGATAD